MKVVPLYSDLISKFRNGDEVAVKQLYQLHYRPLCYYAEKLLHNKAEAEDVAVETFLKLLNKRSDFDNLSDIRSFLFLATRNACFDILRKNKRRDSKQNEIATVAEPDDLFGEKEMITAKVLQVIYAEIENLPGQCKQVFKSIFIEGKSTLTIADEMGISTQTVLNQKGKALKALRLSLYNEGLYTTAVFFSCLFLLVTNKETGFA